MTAVISVPPDLANFLGGQLSRGVRGIPTKETKFRTYFLLPLIALKGHEGLYNYPAIEIAWFRTEAEAKAWVDEDAGVWETVH